MNNLAFEMAHVNNFPSSRCDHDLFSPQIGPCAKLLTAKLTTIESVR